MTTVVVSGYFTVLHKGHVKLFEAAKALGDKLIVIVNNNQQQIGKKGKLIHDAEDIKYIVEKYREIFYDKDKMIPKNILNSNKNIRLQFLIGYCASNGHNYVNTKKIHFNNKGKIGSAQLYYLMKSLGYKCSIKNDKSNIYRITVSTITKQRKWVDPLMIIRKSEY